MKSEWSKSILLAVADVFADSTVNDGQGATVVADSFFEVDRCYCTLPSKVV